MVLDLEPREAQTSMLVFSCRQRKRRRQWGGRIPPRQQPSHDGDFDAAEYFPAVDDVVSGFRFPRRAPEARRGGRRPRRAERQHVPRQEGGSYRARFRGADRATQPQGERRPPQKLGIRGKYFADRRPRFASIRRRGCRFFAAKRLEVRLLERSGHAGAPIEGCGPQKRRSLRLRRDATRSSPRPRGSGDGRVDEDSAAQCRCQRCDE